MGDMKTPDFDDLLAAFDIPDATGLDAKEPIQGHHENTENHQKHEGMCLDENSLLAHQAPADIPVISVIVKNTSRQESLEDIGDRLHSGATLQNGFRGSGTSIDSTESTVGGFTKTFSSTLNGDGSRELHTLKPEPPPIFSQTFSQFSPISSPESEESHSGRDDIYPKQEISYFPAPSVLVETARIANQKQLHLNMFVDSSQGCDILENTLSSRAEPINGPSAENARDEDSSQMQIRDEGDKGDPYNDRLPSPIDYQKAVESNCSRISKPNVSPSLPCVQSQTSSCLEALTALHPRKDPTEQTVVHDHCVKASSKVPISPQSPRSPLQATVTRLLKPSDSPGSICSDGSGIASPVMTSGSPPAIPRVRIKTIKTVSGLIRRTVTNVLPDSETDEIQSPCESSPSQTLIREDSYCKASPRLCQSMAADGHVGLHSAGTAASAASSSVTQHSSTGPSRRTGLMQPPTVIHDDDRGGCGRPVKARVSLQRQKQKIGAPGPGATNTHLLPKAMHLAKLNLVPHSVAASVSARSASHQQSQRAFSPSSPSAAVCSAVPLVHQVKPPPSHARPCMPNTAAGTLNKLLSNGNPVPTYVPDLNPPAESDIALPSRGYCCLECGDSFGVERSLLFHYGRRSVHIEVACTHCARTLVFFNRCALLAHAREHKSSGVVMQCTQLHMKPIAEEQMFAPLGAETPVRVHPYSSQSSHRKSQPVMPLYADNVIRHRLRCLECNKQLPDYRALAGHYQRPMEDTEGLTCKVCSMLLPNKCSYRAHQRIHAHKSPYCCPECGALSRSADIQKHVRENCLHYARKVWYKCLHCDMVCQAVQGQKNHIEEQHCEVFYKCSICPVAFKSSESSEIHMKNKHNASKISPQLVFKCSCETVFKKKQLFFQHFHQNANKRATCVFKCPECSTVLAQKQLLMQHFKSVHGGIVRAEADKSHQQTDGIARLHNAPSVKDHRAAKQTDVPRKRAAQDGKPPVKNIGWTCGECLQWVPDRDAYVSHMKASHGKSLKRYPCRQCELSFNSTTSLRRHIRNEHGGKNNSYTCWYCTDTKIVFTSGVMLKNHISLMHGIKNADLSLMPKMDMGESKKNFGEGFNVKRPANGIQEDRWDRTSSQDISLAKRLKAHLRCSSCGFTTEDSVQFQHHIPQHKAEERTPQCLHCGLCFTSPQSLNRHLFIVHKVRSPVEEAGAALLQQDSGERPARSPEALEVKNLMSQQPHGMDRSVSHAEMPLGLHCDKTTLCNVTLSSRLQTHTVIAPSEPC